MSRRDRWCLAMSMVTVSASLLSACSSSSSAPDDGAGAGGAGGTSGATGGTSAAGSGDTGGTSAAGTTAAGGAGGTTATGGAGGSTGGAGGAAGAPVDACTNAMDAPIVAMKDATAANAQSCGMSCFLDKDVPGCSKECMKTKAGFSDGCATCWGNVIACGIKSCGSKCIAPDSQACTDCTAMNCTPAFDLCAGM